MSRGGDTMFSSSVHKSTMGCQKSALGARHAETRGTTAKLWTRDIENVAAFVTKIFRAWLSSFRFSLIDFRVDEVVFCLNYFLSVNLGMSVWSTDYTQNCLKLTTKFQCGTRCKRVRKVNTGSCFFIRTSGLVFK